MLLSILTAIVLAVATNDKPIEQITVAPARLTVNGWPDDVFTPFIAAELLDADDINWLRYQPWPRIVESMDAQAKMLDDAPADACADEFHYSAKSIAASIAANRAELARLTEWRSLDAAAADKLTAAIADVSRRGEAWRALYIARVGWPAYSEDVDDNGNCITEYPAEAASRAGVFSRRDSLRTLRTLIGDTAFILGEMPAPIPAYVCVRDDRPGRRTNDCKCKLGPCRCGEGGECRCVELPR